MKVKKIIEDIRIRLEARGFEVVEEYPTSDKTRVDLAVLRDGEPAVAVEFEKTYKWIQQRVLYNSIKAYRAGFTAVVFVYPFNRKPVLSSWVMDFIQNTLGVGARIVHPDDCMMVLDDVLG